MITQYDPTRDPDATEWLAMDESARMLLVQDYHRKARIRLPNDRLHAMFHTVVENQLAGAGDAEPRETLNRLMSEGLDRHDAVHAMGSVLAVHMHRLMTGKASGDPNAEYNRSLKELTVAKWRAEQSP